MAGKLEPQSALQYVLPKLQRTEQDARPVVAMICGISGAGKSTLAKEIIQKVPNFVRLSVDVLVYEKHGLYAIDYPREKYEEYLDEGQNRLKGELERLIKEKKNNIALDLSFWNKEYRDEYKELIERSGGRWVLVFLDAEKEVLWRRITSRRAHRDALGAREKGRDGDSAFDVDEKTFEMYCSGFEKPVGEGEITIQVV
ncbi:ATP/GTP-binding protein [Mariannaea sp. PMI_226]|nr:ATP/GTP-binding protein [Mariannaea sp. PMI_226]